MDKETREGGKDTNRRNKCADHTDSSEEIRKRKRVTAVGWREKHMEGVK